MTLVLTAWTPLGGVMAADERISYIGPEPLPPPVEGRRKIIPWPEMNAAVGFPGVARAPNGQWTDELLEGLMNSRRWEDLDEFAQSLINELPKIPPLGIGDLRAAVKVSVTGFGRNPSPTTMPCFWHVRNTEWHHLWPGGFRANEDLRETVLRKAPVDARFWVTRWIGRHDAYAQRAEPSLTYEGSRALNLAEVATWASREIIRVRLLIARMIAIAQDARGEHHDRGRPSAPWMSDRRRGHSSSVAKV